MPDFPVLITLRLMVSGTTTGPEACHRARETVINRLQEILAEEPTPPVYELRVISVGLLGPAIDST